MSEARPLDLRDCELLVMTGAGVSAESGIPTFRDANGLWEQHPIEAVASPEGFARDPRLVWRFYSLRREAAARCEPNAGHRAIAAIEQQLGERFLLATQNVDGLHRRAGSERVIELHGSLFHSRCARGHAPPFADGASYVVDDLAGLPRCACGGAIRPHIVWFGEMLDRRDLERVDEFFARGRAGRKLVYLVAGTSGLVWPAAGFVEHARAVGARTILVNLEAPANADSFDEVYLGKSGEVLPRLLGEARV
jgi:NAD-dependent deacetylase